MTDHKNNRKIAYSHRILLSFATFLTLFSLALAVNTWAASKALPVTTDQTIRAHFRFDNPGPFRVGDPLAVTLIVETNSGIQPDSPVFDPADLQGLELKQSTPVKTEQLTSGARFSFGYTLVGWQVGKYALTSLTMTFLDRTGVTKTVQLPPLQMEIVSILPKGKSRTELLALDIKGLQHPVSLPPNYQVLKWLIPILLVLVAIVLLLRFLLLKWIEQKNGKPMEELPPEPAHVIASRRLGTIKAADYLEKADYKGYYSELSECIREYMENRYQIHALEMTTEEFLGSLTNSNYLNPEHQGQLHNFLHQSDLVKFAKQAPPIYEAEQALIMIEQLVEATKAENLPLVTDDELVS